MVINNYERKIHMTNYEPELDEGYDTAELRAAMASVHAGTAGQDERDLVEAAYHSDEPFGSRGGGLPELYVAWTAAADTAGEGWAR